MKYREQEKTGKQWEVEMRRKRDVRSKRCSEREQTVRKKEERRKRRTERSMSGTETIWCLQDSTIPADCETLLTHTHTLAHKKVSVNSYSLSHTHISIHRI